MLTELFVVSKLTKDKELRQTVNALLDKHATSGVRAAMKRQLLFTSSNNIAKYVKSSKSELNGLTIARGLYNHIGVGFNYILKHGDAAERKWMIKQFVTENRIDLRRKGLTSLPKEFYELTDLEEIDLRNNKLTNISSKFKVFTKLRVLRLENNKLKKIHSSLSQLPHLEELYLNDNLIEVVPPVLGQLKNLRRLHMINMLNCTGRVHTVELPEGFWKLQLTELGISQDYYNNYSHGFKGIPYISTLKAEEGSFLDLDPLAMAKKHFEQGKGSSSVYYLLYHAEPTYRIKVLSKFYDPDTKTMNLTNVKIKYLPPELATFDIAHLKMKKSGFGYNFSLPGIDADIGLAVIGELSNLETLDLEDNALRHIPPVIFQCTKLQWLSLKGSSIKQVQPEIGNLQQLKYLNLDGSTWSPIQFPTEIKQLTQLQEVVVSSIHHKTEDVERAYITHLEEHFDSSVSISVLTSLKQNHGLN